MKTFSARLIIASEVSAVVFLFTTLVYAQAQVQARPDIQAPGGPIGSGLQLISVIVLGFFALAQVYINSDVRALRRELELQKDRADQAEREIIDQFTRMSAELKTKEEERKATEQELDNLRKEHDRLLRWAYKHKYESSEEIPVRKDPQ